MDELASFFRSEATVVNILCLPNDGRKHFILTLQTQIYVGSTNTKQYEVYQERRQKNCQNDFDIAF